ncbi:MAG: murein hydrolase activator EnvC family protein [Acidimicrobiia bacterium]
MKPARLAVLSVVISLLWAALPVAADDPSVELRRIQNELTEVNRAISTARTNESAIGLRVAAAQTALAAALEDYNDAQAEVDESIRQVQLTEGQVTSLRGQVMTLESALARTEVDLSKTEDRLERTAVDLYMSAAAVPGMRLFGQTDAAGAATVLAYSSAVFDREDDVFDAFQLLQREEERQRVQVVEKKSQTEAHLRSLHAQKALLEQQRDVAAGLLADAQAQAAAVEQLLASIRHDIAAAEQHKEGLEADAAALQREIERLASKEGVAPTGLSWPLNAPVGSPFGYRVHPILGVRRLHTGIDLSAASGTPIVAAATGRVILAETYGGYGRAVVIDHGGGITTLYAHQSKMAVSVGQTVDRGQVVGYVGCSGSCTGPHLHFEVRKNGAPVDPLGYLR